MPPCGEKEKEGEIERRGERAAHTSVSCDLCGSVEYPALSRQRTRQELQPLGLIGQCPDGKPPALYHKAPKDSSEQQVTLLKL